MTNEAAIAHLKRLAAIHLEAVLAEGITEPGAVLARMVELDNAMVGRLCGDLAQLSSYRSRGMTPNCGSRAARGRAVEILLAGRVWAEVNGKDAVKVDTESTL